MLLLIALLVCIGLVAAAAFRKIAWTACAIAVAAILLLVLLFGGADTHLRVD